MLGIANHTLSRAKSLYIARITQSPEGPGDE